VVLIILFILFLAYRDGGLVWIVALSIPFSLIVWVWFISLFWNAVETWVVMILYLENAYREKFGFPLMDQWNIPKEQLESSSITREWIHEAVVNGAMIRLRPVLMTAFTSVIWLLPMIWAILHLSYCRFYFRIWEKDILNRPWWNKKFI